MQLVVKIRTMEPGFGRGRARIRLPEGVTPGIPLRRPSNFKDDLLSNKLQTLSISPGDDSNGLREVIDTIKKTSETEEQLRKHVTSLHEYALTGRAAAALAGKICEQLSHLEVQEVKFRNLLLEKAQKDFKEKDILQATSLGKFHSAIIFLTEIFNGVKLQDGSPIRVLTTPVSQYLIMLLQSSNEEDLFLFCDQMIRTGKQLFEIDRKQFEAVLLQCRRTIVTAELKQTVRCKLLETLECSLTNFAPLSSEVVDLYKELMR